MNAIEWIVAAGLLALCALEFRDRSFRNSLKAGGERLYRNVGFSIAALMVAALLRKLYAFISSFDLALAAWPNLWCEAVCCVLVAELFGWTCHFVKHRNPFLWKFHFQHHREEEYNLWLATHTHGLEVLFSGGLMALVLAFTGFSLPVVEAYLLYYSVAKFFQHSAHDYDLGALDRVFITPAYHQWHHEVESRCNYGVTLTLFDVVFGTVRWPEQERPQKFGVRDELPFGFCKEHTWFLSSFGARGKGIG